MRSNLNGSNSSITISHHRALSDACSRACPVVSSGFCVTRPTLPLCIVSESRGHSAAVGPRGVLIPPHTSLPIHDRGFPRSAGVGHHRGLRSSFLEGPERTRAPCTMGAVPMFSRFHRDMASHAWRDRVGIGHMDGIMVPSARPNITKNVVRLDSITMCHGLHAGNRSRFLHTGLAVSTHPKLRIRTRRVSPSGGRHG